MQVSKRRTLDAIRLALQSATAAAGQFLLMRSLAMPEAFVGVLSAVLVVQPTVGHTLGASLDRIVATLVGSGLGLLCLALLPGGYGTAVALGICMLCMNFLAGFFPQWRYGVVAAVALALGSDDNIWETAADRALAIGLGAVLGTVVTLVVWPDRAIKRARRHLGLALRATADRLDAAVENARGLTREDASEARRGYHKSMESAREAADGIRIGDKEAVQSRIDRVERLYNSALMLNRVAEETDAATQGNEKLTRAVETIRRCGYELTRALAEEDIRSDERMDTIWSALEDAREAAAATESSDHRDHVIRNGLVFGLGEVADSLQSLLDDSSDR